MEPRTGVGVGIDTRIIGGERFHLVEALLDWIGFRFVAEMPLAVEVRRVTVLVEELGSRRSASPEKVLVTGGHHNRQPVPHGDASGHERVFAGRVAGLPLTARE